MSTKYWSDKASGNGHYVQIDLGNAIPLYDVAAYFGSMDYMRNSEYLISEDGLNWTSLGDLQYTTEGDKKVAKVNAEGRMAKYIKILAKGENSGYWVQLFEVEINKTVPDFGSDYVELISGTIEGKVDALYDRDLSTAFELETVNDGDNLVYKMTRITNVENMIFLQDANRISDAKVSVKDLYGNWTEVGVLDKQLTTLAINKNIVEVKLEFNADKPAPKLYEIIINEVSIQENVNKTQLEIAVEIASEITEVELENIVPAVVNEFKAALEEAEALLLNESATQAEVDKSFERLSKVMQMLSFAKGDKEDLIALIDRINKLNKDEYFDSTWVNLEIELENANTVVLDENAMKEEVVESYKSLLRAFLGLRLKPNKDKLNDLINKVQALNSSEYTVASWNKVKMAFEMASKIMNDENATETEIIKAQEELQVAINDLEKVASNESISDEANKVIGSNSNSSSSSNGTNESASSGSVTSNSENSSNKINNLPKTGGRSAVGISFFGAILSVLGLGLFKRKNR